MTRDITAAHSSSSMKSLAPPGRGSQESPIKSQLLLALGLVVLVIALRAAQFLPSIVTYLVLSVLALRSPVWALRAFSAAIFASLLTSAFTNEFIPVELRIHPLTGSSDVGALVGRYLVLAACTYTLAQPSLRQAAHSPPWGSFIAFVAVTFVNCVAVSYEPLVSLLKLTTLGMGVFVVFRLATCLDAPQMTNWFASFFGVVIAAGLPLAFVPQGFMVNGTGFQGLMNHPQVLGVISGILGAHLLVRLLTRSDKFALTLVFFVACLVSTILSEARTGLLAFSLASVVGGLAAIVLVRRALGQSLVLTAAVLLAILVGNAGPQAQDFVSQFINKRSQGTSGFTELYWRTRGAAIEESWNGFIDNPLFGVGFGLPSDHSDLQVRRDPFFNLPISAGVEKGLLATAILEELGVVGGVVALAFVLSIISAAFARAPPEHLAVVVASIASNLGEATLTSVGGLGAFVWLAIGVGLSAHRRHA